MAEKIKVLIVDDSAVVRATLEKALSCETDIEVVGTAPDAYVARDRIVKLKPDVVTLDIEMPRMDGLTFLEKLMTYYPIPVIMVSSVTTQDPYAVVKALEIGAFAVVNKPGSAMSAVEVVEEVLFKIREASQLKDAFYQKREVVMQHLSENPVKIQRSLLAQIKTTDKLIAIGASTGGTVALETIFRVLPRNLPPIVVVQHMPPGFTKSFADRLNDLSELTVKEAEDGDLIQAGNVYIAKGGSHVEIFQRGAFFYIRLTNDPKEHFQRPAVDVLFRSVARFAGVNAMGVLLTGMGKDGAKELLEMKKAGSYTLVQNESSSVVWGMPGTAVALNAHCVEVDLIDVASQIVQWSAE